jgi:hypothetical protein
MTFELTEYNEAHVATVTNRTEKHGEDDVPAVSLGLSITDANTILDRLDPKLRHALYRAADEAQGELPDVEGSTPVLRCNSIDRVELPTKLEGWTLELDEGIDGDEKPMTFGGCKLDKFKAEPKQGGSVVLSFRVGTSDVDADRLGKLAVHNKQSVWIKLHAPKAQEPAINGTQAAFDADHPSEPDAGQLFAAEHADA